MIQLLKIGVMVGVGFIIGMVLYASTAVVILMNNIVPIYLLPLFVIVGIVIVLLYDEFGPTPE